MTIRQDFEKYYMFRSCFADTTRSVQRRADGEYYYFETRNAWDAWKAGIRYQKRRTQRIGT